ncbi:UNVERIFIED_CONTAM: hypothetical protein Sradi_2077100 [Sesamum radiatum]|uniref:GAG-pre-integrase domain-containing protein n=1 Tax=Sesamum radiatum TaxID=300843 RepID=A0AAW2TIJ8_SESRA
MASPSEQEEKGKKIEVGLDLLKMQVTENPGAVLVSNSLTGSNFLSWSRSIKFALRAKMKLGFIDGENPKPAENSEEYEQWVRADSFVISWILNTISKDIVESFLYIDTARDLWMPKVNIRVFCGASKESADHKQQDRLMQFLMGLNDSFDHIRGQILMVEPLPDVAKAYSMVLREERQREVSTTFSSSVPTMAMQVQGFQNGNGTRGQWKRRTAQEKKGQLCTHRGKTGHLKKSYFEIHGYLEWYKTLVDQRKKGGIGANKALNSTDGRVVGQESVQNALDEEAVTELIRGEIKKLMGNIDLEILNDTRSDGLIDFAGKYALNSLFESSKFWIIDSGATSHMCNDISIFQSTKKHKPDLYIHLADGSKQHVNTVGNIQLPNNIQLTSVLHVPSLKFNLLSISKLCDTTNIRIKFYPTCCVLQDHRTNKTVAVGRLLGKLYILDEKSFKINAIESILEQTRERVLAVKTFDVNLWHKRLGHTSSVVLSHLNFLNKSNAPLDLCEVCPLAKQSRLPFPVSKTQTKSVF